MPARWRCAPATRRWGRSGRATTGVTAEAPDASLRLLPGHPGRRIRPTARGTPAGAGRAASRPSTTPRCAPGAPGPRATARRRRWMHDTSRRRRPPAGTPARAPTDRPERWTGGRTPVDGGLPGTTIRDVLAISSPTLVDRSADFARLRTAWQAAVEGRPRLVLLAARPGSEVEAACAEFATEVVTNGGWTATGSCMQLGETPLAFLPVAEIVRRLARSGDPAVTAALDRVPAGACGAGSGARGRAITDGTGQPSGRDRQCARRPERPRRTGAPVRGAARAAAAAHRGAADPARGRGHPLERSGDTRPRHVPGPQPRRRTAAPGPHDPHGRRVPIAPGGAVDRGAAARTVGRAHRPRTAGDR